MGVAPFPCVLLYIDLHQEKRTPALLPAAYLRAPPTQLLSRRLSLPSCPMAICTAWYWALDSQNPGQWLRSATAVSYMLSPLACIRWPRTRLQARFSALPTTSTRKCSPPLSACRLVMNL
ncbi:unnamed protein product, partial [Heterosigma akashiwo]